MKYIIIGQHASGKREVLNFLKHRGCKCGQLFSNFQAINMDDIEKIYNADQYKYFSTKDIMEVFENKAYIFLHELTNPSSGTLAGLKYMEGLSQWDWQENTVFAMSPDQLMNINSQALGNDDICIVWLDATKATRINRHRQEHRKYSFNEREQIEKPYINDLVKHIYNLGNNGANVLYFSNEEPTRIGCIIYTLIKYPDLFNIYSANFN